MEKARGKRKMQQSRETGIILGLWVGLINGSSFIWEDKTLSHCKSLSRPD
jgi:hypothetical protein